MTRRGSVDVEDEGGPWRRRPSSSSRLASLVARAQSLYDGFQAQPMATRLAIVLFGLLYAATIFVVVFVVGPEQVLHYTASFALVIRGLQHARIALVALIVVSSFPPMVGYGTLVTLAGMAFGSAYVPEGTKEDPSSSSSSSSSSAAAAANSGVVVVVDHGPGSIGQAWLVAATGCLLGAVCSFTFLRHVALNSTWGRKVARIDKLRASAQWRAMETAVTRRGWTMALLLRFSPFPFTISNLFFASLQPISLGHFVVATVCTTPKLLLHVFVGARMFELIHRGARASLDDKSRILNGVYVVLGEAERGARVSLLHAHLSSSFLLPSRLARRLFYVLLRLPGDA